MRGGLVVGAGILAGNITGFFRIAVQAYYLGTHARADALSVAIGPIDTLNGAIVNTMLVSFVPMLMLRPAEQRAALFARASRIFFCILAAGSAAVAALAPLLISLMGPGLAVEQHDQAVLLLRLVAPATLFAGGSAIYAALLYTERRFVAPALYQACLNGATIIAAISLWRVMGVKGFAVGYTVGAFIQLALTWSVSRDLREQVRQSRGPKIALREILGRPSMFLIYAGLIAANILVTRAFATHAGPGMAAAFDYCLRLVSVVVAYMVYPVANSLLPEIARLRGANQTENAYKLIDRSVGLMAVAAVASCAVAILLRTPVIRLLFERGNFTPESTLLVSAVFLGFAPSIVGWALMDLISRCSFALDRPRLPLIAAGIPVTINLLIMMSLRGRSNPTLSGLGASIGLLAGFLWLFVAAHLRRPASAAPSHVPEADDEERGERQNHPADFAETASEKFQ
ncbi:MAG: lipid II flippase MurJ [Terriglobia bacterium]